MIEVILFWAVAMIITYYCWRSIIGNTIEFWPELSGQVPWGSGRSKDEFRTEKKKSRQG